MSLTETAEILSSSLGSSEEFQQSLGFLKENCDGQIWLIGGYLYRTLASRLYDIKVPTVDFDFLVEKYVEVYQPDRWIKKRNRYGNPKYIASSASGQNFEVDVVPLRSVNSINRRNLPPTIDNFLTGTPLNVQSIAYDIDEQKVIGEMGMQALLEKKVCVNNLVQARYSARKKRMTVHEMVRKKAEGLGFEAVLQ